jgi:hypothetical protein
MHVGSQLKQHPPPLPLPRQVDRLQRELKALEERCKSAQSDARRAEAARAELEAEVGVRRPLGARVSL